MDDVTRRDVVKLAAVGGAAALGTAAAVAEAQEGAQAKPAGVGQADKEVNEAIAKATDEANAIFDKMRSAVEAAVKRGAKQLNVAEIARRAGLEIDPRALDELQVDRIIHVHPWLPWHHWWPWRPLWCWWWRRYPWYRCCPWWWHRCHWHLH